MSSAKRTSCESFVVGIAETSASEAMRAIESSERMMLRMKMMLKMSLLNDVSRIYIIIVSIHIMSWSFLFMALLGACRIGTRGSAFIRRIRRCQK